MRDRPSRISLRSIRATQHSRPEEVMGSVNACVDLKRDNDAAPVPMENPPVNALKHELRAELLEALPGACDKKRLPRLIAPEKALEATASGDMIAADQARAVGILDAVPDG